VRCQLGAGMHVSRALALTTSGSSAHVPARTLWLLHTRHRRDASRRCRDRWSALAPAAALPLLWYEATSMEDWFERWLKGEGDAQVEHEPGLQARLEDLMNGENMKENC